jgi:hypothetical protein
MDVIRNLKLHMRYVMLIVAITIKTLHQHCSNTSFFLPLPGSTAYGRKYQMDIRSIIGYPLPLVYLETSLRFPRWTAVGGLLLQ